MILIDTGIVAAVRLMYPAERTGFGILDLMRVHPLLGTN